MTTVYAPNTNGTKTTITVTTEPGIGIHVTGGLPDAAVKECLLKVVTTLQGKGYKIPGCKIIIDIANPDRHCAPLYDLPVAIALIAETGQEDMVNLSKFIFAGEIKLDSNILRIWNKEAEDAARSIAMEEDLTAVLPEANLQERPAEGDAKAVPVFSLTDVIQRLRPVYLVKHICIDEDTSGDPVTESTLVFHNRESARKNFKSQKEALKRRLAEQFDVIAQDDDEGDAVFIEKEDFCDAWKSHCAGEYEEWIRIDRAEVI